MSFEKWWNTHLDEKHKNVEVSQKGELVHSWTDCVREAWLAEQEEERLRIAKELKNSVFGAGSDGHYIPKVISKKQVIAIIDSIFGLGCDRGGGKSLTPSEATQVTGSTPVPSQEPKPITAEPESGWKPIGCRIDEWTKQKKEELGK